MKRKSKLTVSVLLTAAVLAGSLLTGCAEGNNYTEEIKQYQAQLESLAAENEALREQLGLTETETGTQESEPAETQTDAETESVEESIPESESESESQEQAVNGDEVMEILVFGDSIWDSHREDGNVATKVEYYLRGLGREAKVYNAAIGGTRATIDPEDSPYTFGPASENSLAKMISVLEGNTDVELLQGKAAYDEMVTAISRKSEIDLVIFAYGMNDFLSQAPINNSDEPWTGFGTALTNGIYGIERICPQAQILIVAPTYASYFSIPVANMGEKALYNYASVACDVGKNEGKLCMDAYNNLGMDAYNADEYLEDDVHLNEDGRDLYARGIASCIFYGREGEVSGNAFDFDQLN